MSGDFDPDKLIAQIDEKFSYMVQHGVPQYKFNQEIANPEPKTVDVYGPDAEYVYIGYRLPGAGTREASLLTLTDLLLSNSSAGLIDLNLVKSQKYLGPHLALI